MSGVPDTRTKQAATAIWLAGGGQQLSLPAPYAAHFDQLSITSCFLELIANEKKTGTASGFFWRHDSKIYLVTNWHVVTGKNAFTKEFLAHGMCPERLRVHFNYRSDPSQDQLRLLGSDARTSTQGQVELYVYREFHAPLWIQHPNFLTDSIDVALLRFDPNEVGINPEKIVCVNDYGFSTLHHAVGADVLIVGFPLDEIGLKFPVWKKGSVASELLLPWRNRPAFLVDCRTSRGMSGSLVIRRVFGPNTTSDMTTNLDAVVTSEFMGVYSGRLHDDENLASIGIVWWRTVIDEILASKHPGNRGT